MNVQAKKPETNKPDAAKQERIVLYIGDDDSYWQTIKSRFTNNYNHLSFTYVSLYAKGKPNDYLKAFLQILESTPRFIYIDMSQEKDFHLRLAQYLTRENRTKNIPIIGLVDSKELLRECISAKVSAIHIKCGEYHDVVYDAVRMGFPREARRPEFARAKCAIETELMDDCRIGFITPTSMHIEGYFEAEGGQEIELFHEINKTILPTKQFVVSSRSTSNLYYEYQYAYDLDLKYIDDLVVEPPAEVVDSSSADANLAKLKAQDLSAKHLKASHESELARIKKKFKQWILSNVDDTAQKKTKILAIDRTLSILKKAEKPLDKYPYAIRFQSALSPELSELDIIRPNLIAYHLEEFIDTDPLMSEEEKQRHKDLENESLNMLSQIFNTIKGMDKYNPFVVVFNCTKYTSKSFQESYKYSLILTNREPITLETVLEMADLYEEKQNVKTNQLILNKIAVLKKENMTKYGRLTVNDFKEQRYFIKKENPISHAYVRHQAKIIVLSESELVLETSAHLAQKSYRLNTPAEMSIAIVPERDTGKLYSEQKGVRTYQAIIHGIGENEKKKLRQIINEVFFIPLNEKREKEQEKFDELNKTALEKKLASLDRDDIRDVPAPAPPSDKDKKG
ncbi:MAG: hypothetical protein HYV97_10800 [Bdellovibrio sp.]|nr:hypothetical protein [Bdellovibrio sp.]